MECNYSKAVAIMLNGFSIGAITDIKPISIDLNVHRKSQTRLSPAMEAWVVNLENERGFSDSVFW
jgi:hypothetical protein